MPKDFTRSDRVAQQIQRELAELLQTEIKDPRLGFVTLTGVEVSRDMSHAKVFYTVLNGDGADTERVLQRTAGFLRSELSRRIKLFKMPELHFSYDHSVERGLSLDKLIDQAVQTRAADDGEAEPRDDDRDHP